MTSRIGDKVDLDGVESDAFVVIHGNDQLVDKVHRHNLFG